jgi:hypothetical protein
MTLLLNVAVFQIGWFSAVLTAANHIPLAGVLVMFLAIALHLHLAERPRIELVLVVLCGTIGAVFDTFLVRFGWVDYPSGYLLGGAAPYWIIAMWMLFATTLNVSLRWLRGNPTLAVLFGLFGGPLAYFTGEKLGGIVLVDFRAAMLALGIGWGVMMPLLTLLATRFDGTRRRAIAAQPLILN